MGETVLLVIVLLLALFGCTQLIRWIVLRLLEAPERDKGLRLLPVRGHRDDLEFVVRAAAVRRRWSGPFFRPERLVLLDAGMDPPTRELAQALLEEVPGVELWDIKKLEDFCRDGLQASALLLE